MMQKAILFDLDDTLIDTKIRHYQVIRKFLEISNSNVLPCYNQYFDYRKCAVKNENIINFFSNADPDLFLKYWHENIESVDFLQFDKQIVDEVVLKNLKEKENYIFILISLRSNQMNAYNQFNKFTFSKLFDHVFFLKHKKIANPKTSVITELKKHYSILTFIGDSPTDFESSQESEVDFMGVETGWYLPGSHKTYSSINEVISKL
jgi:phosphoglycolate phosphatase-like HAD superfamily hydrolase